jgi:hypothetical protein
MAMNFGFLSKNASDSDVSPNSKSFVFISFVGNFFAGLPKKRYSASPNPNPIKPKAAKIKKRLCIR